MSIGVVNAGGTRGAAANVSVPADVSLAAGHYRLVFLSISGQTITTPAGWTKVYDQILVTSSPRRLYVFSRFFQTGDGAQTFTFSGTGNYGASWIGLSSVDPTTPIDEGPGHNGSDSNATALTAPSRTPATAGMLLAFFFASTASASASMTTPSGMTLRESHVGTGSAGHANLLASEQLSASGSTGTRSTTESVSAPWGGLSVTVRPDVVQVTSSDSATGSETVAVAPAVAASDSAAGTDATAILQSSSLTDAAAGTETIAAQRQSSITDSATGTEQTSITAIEYKTFSDTATGTEGAPSIFDATFVSASDSAAGSEAVSYTAAAAPTDAAAGSEQTALQRSSALTDSAIGTEQTAITQQFSASDSAAGAEAVSYTAAAAATDNASGSEQTTIVRSSAVSDSATGSEQTAILRDTNFIADSAAGSESVTLLRDTNFIADSANGTETVAILRLSSVADSATGTEAPAKAGPFTLDSAVGSEEITIVDIPYTQISPLKLGVVYDLVVVARLPQSSGDPLLLEIDPIEWKTLTIVNTLSEPQDLTATCQLSSLTESVVQYLRDPDTLASELRLYRNGKIVFQGPLLGWQTSGETLTLKAQGLLAYLKMMTIVNDLKYVQPVDQNAIVRDMIEQWQSLLTYADFGIDTSALTASGVSRVGEYLKTELNNVYQKVIELGKLSNGFDVEVDPATRQLLLWNPQKGVDRSTGEDAIIFDDRNVTSSDIVCSIAPGDLASDAYTTAKAAAADTTLYSAQYNAALLQKYGRTSVTGTFSTIDRQADLDAAGQGLLAPRGQALLIPGPRVRVTPDADLPDYAEGDTVNYSLGGRLSVTGNFRIRKRTINVGSNGRENVDLELV